MAEGRSRLRHRPVRPVRDAARPRPPLRHPPRRRGSRSVVLACIAAAACATGSSGASLATSGWLAEAGFPSREGWPSALLHADGERTESGRISALLSAVPGLSVGVPRGEGWGVRRRLPDGGRCEMDVWVNGMKADRRVGGGDWTLDFITWGSRLDGIEVHVGPEGPLIDERGCGYVLIWSMEAAAGEEAAFRGDVVGHLDGSIGTADVEIVLEPGQRHTGVGGDHTFEFLDVLPGSYAVVVVREGREVARQPVRVYAHARSSVAFTLVDGGAAALARPGIELEG